MTVTDADGGSRSLREARRIADEVLFPAALDVDRADRVPQAHLELLAEHGFYGLAAPEELSTLDLPDYPAVSRVVEILAGGCLTTAFVWAQHHGAVAAVADTGNVPLREAYLADLAAGRLRGGMAITAAVRPGPPLLRATRVDGGWALDGEAPWVTGWDLMDVLSTAARTEDDMLVWALLDAEAGDSLAAELLDLVAVQASRTVTLRFSDHFVPDERVTALVPQGEWLERNQESVRFNGAFALGIAERAISLMAGDAAGLATELGAARTMLGTATPDQVPAARAACSELALRCAAALTVHHGSRSVLTGAHAQRLVREATFLLVFGTRPGIRAALLERLSTRAAGGSLLA